MVKYQIVSYKNGSIPEDVFGAVSCILLDAFEERVQQGIDFNCGHFTSEDVKKDLAGDSYLFVAYDNNRKPVGTVALKVRRKKGFIYGGYENLGVISACKGKGVASILTDELIKYSRGLNLSMITSSTACNAKSSVRFHQKKGFKIYMKSYGKKYNSYNFILPLNRLQLLNNEPIRIVVFGITTSIAYLKNRIKHD